MFRKRKRTSSLVCELSDRIMRFNEEAAEIVPQVDDPTLAPFQESVRTIVRQYTNDLLLGHDPEFALKLARMDLKTVLWEVRGKIHR